MKRLFVKWLAALLIAAFMLSSAALMEADVPEEETVEEIAAAEVDAVVAEETFGFGEEEETVCEIGGDAEYISFNAAYAGDTSDPDDGDILIDEAHFPDTVFRNYLKDNFDKNKDGKFSKAEIQELTVVDIEDSYPDEEDEWIVRGMNVESLKGIEYFTELEMLFCRKNKLTSLDLSQNTKLAWLYCSENKLTAIDVSMCPELVKNIKKENYGRIGNTVYYDGYFYDEDGELSESEAVLICDPYVLIVGGDPVDPEPAPVPDPEPAPEPETEPAQTSESTQTPAPAPAAPAPDPAPAPQMIPATGKTNKSVVSAAPGSVWQLDLGSATGKKFKSSKKKVATVDQNGSVTIKKAGKTRITFKVGKKKRVVTLTVKDPTVPASVTLNVPTTEVKKGDAITLTASLPEGTVSPIKWKSSNKKVATVNANGVVKFKKAGKVTITATAKRGKKKAKVKFKVGK